MAQGGSQRSHHVTRGEVVRARGEIEKTEEEMRGNTLLGCFPGAMKLRFQLSSNTAS